MEYRKSKKLSIIPLSKSLITVAQIHSRDLAENHPHNEICNAHSWSNNGAWESCCYTSDHAKASCMWNKPKELTNYNYPGYEIACAGAETLSPIEALENWKTIVNNHIHIISARNIVLEEPVNEPPEDFLCPITYVIMDDPVIAMDGYTYERLAIETWFRANQTSPMTNVVLDDTLTLIPNFTMRSLIASWN